MKKIVFAYGVSDVTVARYCSAMGVDIILIDLDQRNLEENNELIKNIKEWTEGPEIILISDNSEKLDFLSMENGLQLIHKKDLFVNQFELTHKEYEKLIFQCFQENQLYRTNLIKIFIITDSIKINEIPDQDAYMILMGKENKIGLFDFERMDLIFERIQIFN